MAYIFEIKDKSGRRIRLTRERLKHINKEHPLVKEEEIKQTLKNPLKIIEKSGKKPFYYQYFKYKNLPYRYLRVIVRYLNGDGFIVTAYFVKGIS